jgi:aspartyl-tRNA(Asn)/glutamyl-tRNA(Gln) amidotransferase subunit C
VIDADVVRHVARLARLGLSEDEVEQMKRELSVILDYVDEVQDVDLTGVPPTTHVVPLVNVTRPDEASPSLDRELALREAPRVADHAFAVPKI